MEEGDCPVGQRVALTSSNSSVILRMISAFCMFRNISIRTVPGQRATRGVSAAVGYLSRAVAGERLLLPLQPEHWMKKLMRSSSARSLSCLYDSIHSSTTDCRRAGTSAFSFFFLRFQRSSSCTRRELFYWLRFSSAVYARSLHDAHAFPNMAAKLKIVLHFFHFSLV